MLVLTVELGDVIQLRTPLGVVRIVVGGCSKRPTRRRLGIDAPRGWPIKHLPGGTPDEPPRAKEPG